MSGDDPDPRSMTEQIFDLRDGAMLYGLREADFWDMDIDEVLRYIDIENQRRKQSKLQTAYNIYNLADLVSGSVARLFAKGYQYPEIEDVFPDLFTNDEKEAIKQDRMNKVNTARFLQFANAYNQKYRGGKNNNG